MISPATPSWPYLLGFLAIIGSMLMALAWAIHNALKRHR